MTEIIAIKEKQDPMIMMLEMAKSKDIDVEKLQALIEMQKDMMNQDARIAFNEDMAAMQKILPTIHRSKSTHNSKYATYEDIEKKVRPIYTQFGFSISYTSKTIDNRTFYHATLRHVKGFTLEAEMDLKDESSGSKNVVQAKGSSMSYAKRYLLCMLLNIVTTDEDDDGKFLSTSISDKQAKHIKDKIEELNIDVVKFLKFVGAKDVDSINISNHGKALQAIEMKSGAK